MVGQRQVSKCTSAEKGTLVTTCAIVSAAGNSIPPVMVFPRVHFRDHMLADGPPGALGLAYPSGWMTCENFTQVMMHFIKHTASSKDNPSLLIYDNHESHLNIEAIDLAKENGVTLMTIPPHSSAKLQPLDVGIFKPFSVYYDQAVDEWMMQNPGKTFSIYQVAACVNKAHKRAMTPTTICNAFRKTGIFPFDRGVFTDADFLCSYVTDRPEPQPTQTNEPHANVSNNNAGPAPEEDATENLPCPVSNFNSPENFRGYPKAQPRKIQNRRRVGKTRIATDTPEREELANRKRKAIAPPKKARKKLLQHESKSESSEDEEEIALVLDDTDSDIEEPEADIFNMDREPEIGDFVLVEFNVENKCNKIPVIYYIGEILSQDTRKEDFEISFLRSSKVQGKFRKPDVPDVSTVKKSDIKSILPKPLLTQNKLTKRQMGYLSFGIDFGSKPIVVR